MPQTPPPPSPSTDPDTVVFEERDPIDSALRNGAFGAGAGLVVSAIQNSLGKHRHGALGIFTRTGSTIALFGAVSVAFGFTDAFVANRRQKDDSLNGAAAGCASGLIVGASTRSVPTMFGSCAALAALVGTFDAAGRSLSGTLPKSAPAFSNVHLSPDEREHEDQSGAPGESGWRVEREKRRREFFKRPEQDGEGE